MRSFLISLITLVPVMAYAAPESVDELNQVLRGELSAIETYRQALEKVKDQPDANKLVGVLEKHKQAAEKLKAHIYKLGGTPSTDSGAWGSWAQTVTGTAKLFGDESALRALREGEQHGLKEYTELLEEDSVPSNIKDEVRSQNIPTQQANIKLLDEFINKI